MQHVKQKTVRLENLHRVYAYYLNDVDSRRTLYLNILMNNIYHLNVKNIIKSKSTTIYQVIDVLKGSKQKAFKDNGYDQLKQFNITE